MARQKLDNLAFLSYPVRFIRRERQFLQHCALAVCFKVLLQCNQNVWIERKDEETYRIAEKNFKIFNLVILILNVTIPCVFEALLLNGKIKLWRLETKQANLPTKFKLKNTIAYLSFAFLVIALHLLTALFLLIAVILIRRGLIKE